MIRGLRTRSTLASLALLACALLLPSAAAASRASIHRVLRNDLPTILKAEGHVLSAEGEYTSTHNPAPLEAAIETSVTALSALRHKVESQSAFAPKVKAGKSRIVKGLEAIIVGYGDLKTAFAEKLSDPTAAKSELESALSAVKTGKRELNEGTRLLA